MQSYLQLIVKLLYFSQPHLTYPPYHPSPYLTFLINLPMSTLKQQLYQRCHNHIADKEAQIKTAITDARETIANETKSSAGDKYETTREMMQQEIDQNLARLAELDKLKATLNLINPLQTGSVVVPGSVVYTSNGNYYISISAGLLKVDGATFYAISAASPLGSHLIGKTIGQSFQMNGKQFLVTNVL